jgi:hypothetical protein
MKRGFYNYGGSHRRHHRFGIFLPGLIADGTLGWILAPPYSYPSPGYYPPPPDYNVPSPDEEGQIPAAESRMFVYPARARTLNNRNLIITSATSGRSTRTISTRPCCRLSVGL